MRRGWLAVRLFLWRFISITMFFYFFGFVGCAVALLLSYTGLGWVFAATLGAHAGAALATVSLLLDSSLRRRFLEYFTEDPPNWANAR